MAFSVVNDGGSDGGAIPYFKEIVGRKHDPYPWQRRLYGAFVAGRVPAAVDIPTGLGKTLSVLLFLLARLRNPALPSRVAYIVDRRAIVDQTAAAVRAWIERMAELPCLAGAFDRSAAFPADLPVQLGVLRGGLADDGEWRVDPARPAVVVGTVDMIGSRILFSGYGDGRSRRAMHAGLLGHDCVAMLDEAHLSPAMEKLVRDVDLLQGHPKFRTMTLSATGGDRADTFLLLPEDEADPGVRRRLGAVKILKLHSVEKPADHIRRMCALALDRRSGAVAVFVRTVAAAEKVAARLTAKLGESGPARVALLTGTLRGKERAALTDGEVWKRFLPGRERRGRARSVYLVTTAAGEVGVDLDADHCVMDLNTLDSTIQRAGRVNRAGFGEATVSVVFTRDEDRRAKALAREGRHETAEHESGRNRRNWKVYKQRLDDARARTLGVLRELPDLSPASVRKLDKETVEKCVVPPSRPVPLRAEVVESFAATSAKLQLPPVSIYLHGVSDPEPPETCLLWRWDIPCLVRLGEGAVREAISFFRPRSEEIARLPSSDARKVIEAALERQGDGVLSIAAVGGGGDVRVCRLKRGDPMPPIEYATVFLPTAAGGLDPSGLPTPDADEAVSDVGDDGERVRYIDAETGENAGGNGEAPHPEWLDDAIELRVPVRDSDDEEGEERYLVYALRRFDPALQAGESDLTRLGASTQTVDEHCSLVGDAARGIGEALALPEVDALEAAGRWHDRGKVRRVWQRAAGTPTNGPPLAKSRRGRFRAVRLGGYRHEFGSLAEAEHGMPHDVPDRDLILHLIAAHHGWARPGFPDARQWDPELPAGANRRLALRVADRFARLQAEYGPWRLAWLEALLKAADAHASGRGTER